ncbi:MAG: ammonium transporter, partial [Planctomycetia bacterium]|nr:ammonium transporter [Planctomycetia bacterium]
TAEDPLAAYIAEADYTINTLIMFICAVLVLFMQAGFAMVEIGLNSAKNAVNILAKNVMDLCIGVLLYLFIGFSLMYPGDAWMVPGWIGNITPFVVGSEGTGYGDYSSYADFLFQVAFAATAATIVSGAVAGRMKFSAYLVYSAILTGLIYPISGAWKWGGGWCDALGFQDFAGSIVVHAVGGFAGLAGAIFLGPRIGRFSRDGKSMPIPGHNISFAALGVFILWVGWYGFNPGSQLTYAGAANANATTYIALTTTLAAAAGAVTALLTGWVLFSKPDVTMALNGVLGGLVAITANCDRVSQGESLIIGLVGGLLVVMGILILEKFKIDDPVGAWPVHGLCGVWGGLATGIFGDLPDGIGSVGEFFTTQLICTVSICAWAFITMSIVFGVLKAIGMLRVSPEVEQAGLDLHEHGLRAYPLGADQ